jgi:uncharacterized protein (DUF362 family)
MKRREFVRAGSMGIAATIAFPQLLLSSSKQDAGKTFADAVRVENGEPEELLHAALRELGGMERFVRSGDVVVIKPNIGWDRAPEYAANTNPELINALVKSCIKAGAKKVQIFDRTCNNPLRCYTNSKIADYGENAGAEVIQIRDNRFQSIVLKNGKRLENWEIYKDYLEADKVINVPIAKHHGLDNVTLGLKNLMGVMGGNRGSIHSWFAEKIIDIDSAILPALTIIDAYRILTDGGPRGGDLDDVVVKKTLIASPCIATADRLALDLFGHDMNDIEHVAEAWKRGINLYDWKALNVKKVQLS